MGRVEVFYIGGLHSETDKLRRQGQHKLGVPFFGSSATGTSFDSARVRASTQAEPYIPPYQEIPRMPGGPAGYWARQATMQYLDT